MSRKIVFDMSEGADHYTPHVITDKWYEDNTDIATIELDNDYTVSAECISNTPPKYTMLDINNKKLDIKILSYEEWKILALTKLQMEIIDTDEPLPRDKALEPILLARYQDYVVSYNKGLQKYVYNNLNKFDEQLDKEAILLAKTLRS